MVERFDEIERLTFKALSELIRNARGTCVTFTCKKLAKMAKLSTKPVTLTLVREVLEQLRREGLISIYKVSSHGIKYMITRDSPLWHACKTGEVLSLRAASDISKSQRRNR
ncbi:MAG: hypothetical protein DRN15_08315 [Thermoprotei archaeon]|nr:MAG: hypothetical protein DRN15_08315 [Thermoprotei archaeon]RLF25440.1 MAG: hypothetical protein DRM97_01725 [Thermoprotei archaeon]